MSVLSATCRIRGCRGETAILIPKLMLYKFLALSVTLHRSRLLNSAFRRWERPGHRWQRPVKFAQMGLLILVNHSRIILFAVPSYTEDLSAWFITRHTGTIDSFEPFVDVG
ncbi:uncharacterized protein BO72DRAFT_200006 [Aspergillus fijiensis CBS 313.89]|uniref:Uncharacterized protein n=1 Tax=Aspergillus fijiensis CBS 313.89 TaxID=1448319 RepID=A0A8G1VVJ5_9EURO|nr:uncharacterized protein BO72DRAFT_200006 [Aspergillus fijiensis CBS 313.89]RAK74550.1 hypothetical protein BO72DRAFT_200006 [Aspergillus fijiensis CBS 313.89]